MINTDKIAMEYALKQGCNFVRKIGERNGYIFYEYFKLGRGSGKRGLGLYVKINCNGTPYSVEEYEDILWGFNN